MKYFIILIVLFSSFKLKAQTVLLNETFGYYKNETECETVKWIETPNVYFSSSVSSPLISPHQESRGYLDASGNSNLLFTNIYDSYVEFSHINTVDFQELNLVMAILKTTPESNGSELIIEMGDGNKMKEYKIILPSGQGTQNTYHLFSIKDIPSVSNLTIRFKYVSSTSKCKFRIDDIKLTGCKIPKSPNITQPSPACLFKLVEVPTNTFLQDNPQGKELTPINIVLKSGTYYARTISTVYGCSNVWSNASAVYVKIDSLPIILKHPKNSITIFKNDYTYNFIAKSNFSYIWEFSKDNGMSWLEVNNLEPFTIKTDTLAINFKKIDYKLFNGYQFRIVSYNGGCKTYSNHGTLITGSELPIKLTSLQGDVFFNINSIDFSTNGEKETDRFEIERSGDNVRWDKIGSLKSAENSNTHLNYTFYDNHPLKNVNYYRLKMYTLDKNYVYSPTIIIQNSEETNKVTYFDLSGAEVLTLLPNNYYIETLNGVARRVVMFK